MLKKTQYPLSPFPLLLPEVLFIPLAFIKCHLCARYIEMAEMLLLPWEVRGAGHVADSYSTLGYLCLPSEEVLQRREQLCLPWLVVGQELPYSQEGFIKLLIFEQCFKL